MVRLPSLILLLIGLWLSGCQSALREQVFDAEAPDLAQTVEPIRRPLHHPVGMSAGTLEHWTRDAGNEIEQLFPELPNPRLVMYVFPHLTDEGAPVPGYATAFYLYRERGLFALPGEVDVE